MATLPFAVCVTEPWHVLHGPSVGPLSLGWGRAGSASGGRADKKAQYGGWCVVNPQTILRNQSYSDSIRSMKTEIEQAYMYIRILLSLLYMYFTCMHICIIGCVLCVYCMCMCIVCVCVRFLHRISVLRDFLKAVKLRHPDA